MSTLAPDPGRPSKGARIEQMPKDAFDKVLADYPRAKFKAEFPPCLQHQAGTKSDSQIAAAVGIGILDRMQPTLGA